MPSRCSLPRMPVAGSSTDTGRLGRRRSRRVSDRRRLGFETRPHRRVSLRRVLSYLVMPLQASSGSAAREPPESDSQVSNGVAGLGGLDVWYPPEPVTPGLDQPIHHPAPCPCCIPRRHLSGSGYSRLRASTASSMPALAAVVSQRQASTSSGGSSRVASRTPRLYWALVWPALAAVVSGASASVRVRFEVNGASGSLVCGSNARLIPNETNFGTS